MAANTSVSDAQVAHGLHTPPRELPTDHAYRAILYLGQIPPDFPYPSALVVEFSSVMLRQVSPQFLAALRTELSSVEKRTVVRWIPWFDEKTGAEGRYGVEVDRFVAVRGDRHLKVWDLQHECRVTRRIPGDRSQVFDVLTGQYRKRYIMDDLWDEEEEEERVSPFDVEEGDEEEESEDEEKLEEMEEMDVEQSDEMEQLETGGPMEGEEDDGENDDGENDDGDNDDGDNDDGENDDGENDDGENDDGDNDDGDNDDGENDDGENDDGENDDEENDDGDNDDGENDDEENHDGDNDDGENDDEDIFNNAEHGGNDEADGSDKENEPRPTRTYGEYWMSDWTSSRRETFR